MSLFGNTNSGHPGRLDLDQLSTLSRDGFVVVPNVVNGHLVNAALKEIDTLISSRPPPEHRGYHFIWCNDVAPTNPLQACLRCSPAFNIVETAIAPNRLENPRQIQVSINIPPWNHKPGGPHLDGLTPPEPGGRPSTFTLLAGYFPHGSPGRGHGQLVGLARNALDERKLFSRAR